MNPGMVEEGAKVATSTIDALKSTPVILFVLLFNVMFMGLITWVTLSGRDLQAQLITKDKDLVSKSMEMLSQCVNPEALKRLQLEK